MRAARVEIELRWGGQPGLTVFLTSRRKRAVQVDEIEMDRLTPIVADTERIRNRANSLAKSGAQFLTDRGDGSS